MYIIVKQLSKANPYKKRQIVKAKKLDVNAVAMPAVKPAILAPTSAGILPYLNEKKHHFSIISYDGKTINN